MLCFKKNGAFWLRLLDRLRYHDIETESQDNYSDNLFNNVFEIASSGSNLLYWYLMEILYYEWLFIMPRRNVVANYHMLSSFKYSLKLPHVISGTFYK